MTANDLSIVRDSPLVWSATRGARFILKKNKMLIQFDMIGPSLMLQHIRGQPAAALPTKWQDTAGYLHAVVRAYLTSRTFN
ncbi:MAG: hypothetical protein ACKPKO_52610, partial [Candidatus Fonsibacter sp.]